MTYNQRFQLYFFARLFTGMFVVFILVDYCFEQASFDLMYYLFVSAAAAYGAERAYFKSTLGYLESIGLIKPEENDILARMEENVNSSHSLADILELFRGMPTLSHWKFDLQGEWMLIIPKGRFLNLLNSGDPILIQSMNGLSESNSYSYNIGPALPQEGRVLVWHKNLMHINFLKEAVGVYDKH